MTELSTIRRHHLPIARQATLYFDSIQLRITEAAADGTIVRARDRASQLIAQLSLLVLSFLVLAIAWTTEAVLLSIHEARGGSRVLLKGSC